MFKIFLLKIQSDEKETIILGGKFDKDCDKTVTQSSEGMLWKYFFLDCQNDSLIQLQGTKCMKDNQIQLLACCTEHL